MQVISESRPRFDSITARMLCVALLGLVMLIPLAFVSGIVEERHGLYEDVLIDIASSWGGRQTLTAPIVVVPYIERFVQQEQVKDDKGQVKTISKTTRHDRRAIVLPDTLGIQVTLRDEFRRRGIYESLVYTADIVLDGTFTTPAIDKLSDHIEQINWHDAYLVFGLSDTQAINEASALTWDGAPLALAPSTRLEKLLDTGFHAPLGEALAAKPGDDQRTHRFAFTLSVNGSNAFLFAPLGITTHVEMKASWPHPSFLGDALPTQYEVRPDGFSATWDMPHLARNYPQRWTLEQGKYQVTSFTTGVGLFEPVFLYSLVTRAVKYGLLFIALTYLTFLIFEITVQVRLHIVQYGLMGLALALFYLTLLSLAEHVAFLSAYIVASSIIVVMISCYAAAALRSAKRASLVLVLLTGLYTLLYALLHLEDYALLMGTALLLAVIMVLMYVTRHLRLPAAGAPASASTPPVHSG